MVSLMNSTFSLEETLDYNGVTFWLTEEVYLFLFIFNVFQIEINT